ncbi:zinc finger protein ztf-16 isoform X2 [Ischnura elegans]|uniref:zinc finger protein ztf-16 isoform X2 n=1 Tax=Ischnura elegans TaxID=197161 RepID=UPI001ED89BE8|nr:zinc finger protein ztf-16 isoform X2 [Ischnura elegans]
MGCGAAEGKEEADMTEPEGTSGRGSDGEVEADSGSRPRPQARERGEIEEEEEEDGEEEEEENEAEGGQVGEGGYRSPREGPSAAGDGVPNTNYDSGDGSIPVHRCDVCEYETFSWTALQSHMRLHGNGVSTGAYCSTLAAALGASSSSALSSRQKMFECDVCQMRFSNGANMRRHRMRHTGVKPYECRVCAKRFFRKDHLMEHFATHTKSLPYHCPVCNKGFQRQIAMRAHFQNEHVGQSDAVKSCPLCAHRAASMKGLRVHFFHRHGIDLDGGPQGGGCSSPPGDDSGTGGGDSPGASGGCDGESQSPTHPMHLVVPPHFLAPHVEISTDGCGQDVGGMSDGPADFSRVPYNLSPAAPSTADSSHRGGAGGGSGGGQPPSPEHPVPNGCCPSASPASSDSNSNTPSSSHDGTAATSRTENIPGIKGEPMDASEHPPPPTSEASNATGSGNSADVPVVSGPRSSLSRFPLPQAPPLPSRPPPATRPCGPTPELSPLESLLREEVRALPLNRRHHGRSAAVPDNHANGAITSTETEPSPSPCHGTSSRMAQCPPPPSGTASPPLPVMPAAAHCSSPATHRALRCLFCGIVFPDRTLYFLHKGCHSENNPWKCNICGERCSDVYDFNSHLLSKTHQ